jgi:hypothetical protein
MVCLCWQRRSPHARDACSRHHLARTAPPAGPWHFATCHQHWHLQGYADYYITGVNPGYLRGDVANPCDSLPPCPKGNACR